MNWEFGFGSWECKWGVVGNSNEYCLYLPFYANHAKNGKIKIVGDGEIKQICCIFGADQLEMKKHKPTSISGPGSQKEADKAMEPVALYAPDKVDSGSIPKRRSRREATSREQIHSIRQGNGYDAIELLSSRLGATVTELLPLFELAQTTYNKKKREQARMNRRDTELLLFLNALIDFGIDVFNGEEPKFQRWLRKPNISLGGATPFSLLDTITGMQEVHECLDRLEYGNFA